MAHALADLRVVELATTDAGAFFGLQMAGLGADVVKVEALPNGDPTRQSGLILTPDGTTVSPRFVYLNGGKRGLAIDPGETARLERLLSGADVVIDDGLADELGVEQLLREARVAVRIRPFGGALAIGSSLTTAAHGGWLATCGDPDREPLHMRGHHPERVAGLTAFIGALAALRLPRRETAHRVDVAVADVVAANLELNDLVYTMFGAERRRWYSRQPHFYPIDVFPCRDGDVHLIATFPAPRGAVALLVDRPDAIDADIVVNDRLRIEHPEEFDQFVAPWLAEHSKEEVVEAGQALRMPVAAVNTMQDLLSDPQLEHRGFFTVVEHAGTPPLRQPGGAWLSSTGSWRTGPAPPLRSEMAPTWEPRRASPGGALGGKPQRPLQGIRVVDLSMVYGGPTCTRILADLGADVIKVESGVRPDGVRLLCLAENRCEGDYWNRGGYFLARNLGKRGVSLDLSRPEGQEILWQLLEQADVFVEAFSPRVVDGWGMSWESVSARNTGLVMVSMSGFGHTGPQGDWVAFGMGLESSAGITALSGYSGGPVRRSGLSYTDPISGIVAAGAVMSALYERDRTGRGQYVDLAQRDAGTILIGDELLEAQLTGRNPERRGNRHPDVAPHGVFPCAGDDEWIAIAIWDDAMWRRLGEQAGLPELRAPQFQTNADRLARQDELESAVSAWTRGQDRQPLASRLRRSAIDAAPVLSGKEVVLDPYFRAQGLHQIVQHPSVDPRPFARQLPLRIDGVMVGAAAPAPMLGQHTDEVLTALGHDATDIARLRQNGIIAEQPAQLIPEALRPSVGFHVEALVKHGAFRMDPAYREALAARAAGEPIVGQRPPESD